MFHNQLPTATSFQWWSVDGVWDIYNTLFKRWREWQSDTNSVFVTMTNSFSTDAYSWLIVMLNANANANAIGLNHTNKLKKYAESSIREVFGIFEY